MIVRLSGERNVRAILFGFALFAGFSTMGSSSAEEDFYYDHVAALETGSYETNGVVYFQVKSTNGETSNRDSWRRHSLLSVQRQMVEWITRHAPTYDALPDDVRKMDVLCERFGQVQSSAPVSVKVPGRGFSVEEAGFVAYAFVAAKGDLLREAAKGVPGRSTSDITERWKRLCSRLFLTDRGEELVKSVGCGSLNIVAENFAERCGQEFKFLGGWRADSRAGRLLLSDGPVDVPAEEPWLAGLQIITDLNQGFVDRADSVGRLYEAIEETPGVAALWCHLGRCLMDRKLYALAAHAYKNAFCLSTPDTLPAVLAASADDLSHAYKALKDDRTSRGYALLAKAFR